MARTPEVGFRATVVTGAHPHGEPGLVTVCQGIDAYMRALDRSQPRFDNEQAECALDDALGHMQNFRQAVRERDE